ncbi:MAG: hypothetical protein OXN90_20085, partial [Gemmatimonadota bacterium]|nr:hypothetical protein [Caldilineaceae bacterium]MDE2810721.1 hypothetical protein [Gemmatimonadota bacterium]
EMGVYEFPRESKSDRLLAGIFSSSDGTWVPMPQLRRFSSVGAWMVAFGMIAYGSLHSSEVSEFIKCYGIVSFFLLYFAVALGSYAGFLWIGGQQYGVESVGHKEKKDG